MLSSPVSMTPVPVDPVPAPGQPGSPPEASEWRVGTLAYTRRGLVRLFSWLLWGDFAWSVRDRSLGPILQILVKNFQASDKVFGLLTGTMPAAIGIILGPVISLRSDRYRGPRGRRIPFLLVSAPVAALAIFGLGSSPVLGHGLDRALGSYSPGYYPSVLIVLGIWWALFDAAATVTNSIFNALINDTVPHGVIGRFFGLMRAVSLIVGAAYNFWLLKPTEHHYQWMFLVVGALYGAGVVSMCLQVREGEYPPPLDEGGGNTLTRFANAVRGYFRECFTHPYYLWYFVASNLALAATGPVNAFTIPYYKALNIDTGEYGKYIAITYVISLCLSYPLGILADRWHPLRLGMGVIALYGVVTLAGAWMLPDVSHADAFTALPSLARPWVHFYPGAKWIFAVALILHGVISGTYFTAAASLAWRLLPKENFAQFASAGALIGAGVNLVMPVTLGTVLDAHGHNYRITYAIAGVMSFLALGCLSVVYRYWKKYGGPHHFTAPQPH